MDRWVSVVASRIGDDNRALRLLRDALGGTRLTYQEC